MKTLDPETLRSVVESVVARIAETQAAAPAPAPTNASCGCHATAASSGQRGVFDCVDKAAQAANDAHLQLKKLGVAGRAKVIEIVKSNLECELAENQVTLSVSPLPVIVAQKIGIIQLFQNLVHNAIKFRAEAAPIIQLSSTYKADTQQWEFKLTDNGMGMSNDYQAKVFQPFQRLNGIKIPGIGMGLAICQKVVKSHGGHIYYESALSVGTTFTFTLSSLKS